MPEREPLTEATSLCDRCSAEPGAEDVALCSECGLTLCEHCYDSHVIDDGCEG